MINVSKLKKGIIIDHIEAGHGFEIYKELHLNDIDDVVVLLKNIPSKKMKQKDLIKIETDLQIDMTVRTELILVCYPPQVDQYTYMDI